MRVSINAYERELAQTAVTYGDRQCESARKALEALHLEDLHVMALQGQVDRLRVQLNNTKKHVYDWSFDERRALAICLRIYRDKLKALANSELKLGVDVHPNEEKRSDLIDFAARLAGQESLFEERATESDREVSASAPVADAVPAQQELDVGEERPEALEQLITEREKDSADWTHEDHRTWLADVAGALERGPARYKSFDFTTTVQYVLPSLALLVPGFDGTRAGGFLLQEMVHDEVNAVALASWIRQQLTDPLVEPEDPPPPKLSTDQVNEIRQALGKDPLELSPEAQDALLAENSVRNPLEIACLTCSAAAGTPCRAKGKIVGAAPHLSRSNSVGVKTAAQREIAAALYRDAVARELFGRVDDEVREAMAKHGPFALSAKWVQTLQAAPGAGEARA